MEQPDIVLLVLDTQRADRLSCYGCPVETSPHLDALATEATLFTHAIAPAQWTIPSHASMFTGLYPSQHAMLQLDSALPAELPTLAGRLRQAGYLTAGLSNNAMVGRLNNGFRRGFDTFSNYDGLLTWRPRAGAPGGSPDRRRGSLGHLLARLVGRVQSALANSDTANKVRSAPLILPLWQMALKLRGNLKGDTARTLSDAAHLLIERPGTVDSQPVFVFVNLMGAHSPYDPPRWAVERFAPELNSRVGRAFLRRANWLRLHNLDFVALAEDHRLGAPGCKELLDALYNAEVAAQDAQVGVFLEHLRVAGALDRTLLMVVADHGDHLGERHMIGHAFGVYEELIRVPLLIRDPLHALPRPARVTSFVSTRRLFHTALAAAGAATPAEEPLSLIRVDALDADAAGQSIAFAEAEPLLAVIRLLERRRIDPSRAFDYGQPCRAIYSGAHKLIAIGDDHVELYAVRDDPAESRDLRHALPQRAETLHERLRDFVQQAHPIAGSEARLELDDPILLQQLRSLGYLE